MLLLQRPELVCALSVCGYVTCGYVTCGYIRCGQRTVGRDCFSPLCYVVPGDWAQVFRHGSKHITHWATLPASETFSHYLVNECNARNVTATQSKMWLTPYLEAAGPFSQKDKILGKACSGQGMDSLARQWIFGTLPHWGCSVPTELHKDTRSPGVGNWS